MFQVFLYTFILFDLLCLRVVCLYQYSKVSFGLYFIVVPKLVVEHFKCNNCDAEIEVPSAQVRDISPKVERAYNFKAFS